MADLSLLVLGGLVAGTLGGLLGIGGGVILMPLLRFGVGLSPAFSAGTCVLAVFFTTAGGSYRHYKLGHIDLRSIAPIVIAGLVASALFSLVFQILAARGRWLDLGVGLLFLLVSTRMIADAMRCFAWTRADESPDRHMPGSLLHKAAVGAAGGALPGLLGVGTGSVLVPVLTLLLKAPVRLAVAASLSCFCVTALISAAFKSAQGYVDWGVAIPICAGTMVGANLGALLSRRLSSTVVKALFGCLFLYVSAKFVFAAFEGTSR